MNINQNLTRVEIKLFHNFLCWRTKKKKTIFSDFWFSVRTYTGIHHAEQEFTWAHQPPMKGPLLTFPCGAGELGLNLLWATPCCMSFNANSCPENRPIFFERELKTTMKVIKFRKRRIYRLCTLRKLVGLLKWNWKGGCKPGIWVHPFWNTYLRISSCLKNNFPLWVLDDFSITFFRNHDEVLALRKPRMCESIGLK